MKKYYFLIILTLILGLVLTGCLLSNVGQVPTTEQSGITYLTKAGTETDPDVFTLYAGQTIPVGTVSVWNDGVELHVTYNTTGGWEMTETHLAVATSIDDIPQKNGNPPPGQFPHKHENLGGVTIDEYVISLNGWEGETELYIAAHASLLKLLDTVGVDAKKSTSTCSHVILESGKRYLLKASGTAFGGDTIDFDTKYSITKRILGDTWTDLVSGYESYGPNLLGLEVDGVFVDWGAFNEDHVYYWEMDGIGSCISLWIYDLSTAYGNNTGSLTVDIYLEESEESAWAGTKEFSGKNWATYFTYNSETWTRSGEFISTRYLPGPLYGSWEYDVSFTKTFGGDFSHGKIVLTDPNDLEIVANVNDIKSDYPYWVQWNYVPNYAAVGTATYGTYDGNFMFLIADEYIWMALSKNDFLPNPWGVGSVWSSGRDYDILSKLGSYW